MYWSKVALDCLAHSLTKILLMTPGVSLPRLQLQMVPARRLRQAKDEH